MMVRRLKVGTAVQSTSVSRTLRWMDEMVAATAHKLLATNKLIKKDARVLLVGLFFRYTLLERNKIGAKKGNPEVNRLRSSKPQHVDLARFINHNWMSTLCKHSIYEPKKKKTLYYSGVSS